MTTSASHLSVLPGGAPAASSASGPNGSAPGGATQLHLPGPVQVYIHLGQHSAAQAQPVPAPPPRRIVLLALVGLVLAGGGYIAGSRTVAGLPPDAAGAFASGSALPLPPPLDGTADLPPALRQHLARPPVVTPPPGTTAAGSASGPPSAPTRNPFGLGN